VESTLRFKRKKRDSKLPELSMNPLIDTALTLLIIFMVTTPMLQNSINVDLPKGKSQEDTGTKQELVINIDKEENIFFNNEKIELKELNKAIKNQIGDNLDQVVFVKGDESIKYGKLIDVVDSIKYIGGLKNVVLATKRST
jgi:biopolymer transport protein TolR